MHGAIDRPGPTITTQSIEVFARMTRKRMRTKGGRYPRGYLSALARRVEVAAKKSSRHRVESELLRTLVVKHKTVGFDVAQFRSEVARPERFELPTR
jgi:hypothetical protein